MADNDKVKALQIALSQIENNLVKVLSWMDDKTGYNDIQVISTGSLELT